MAGLVNTLIRLAKRLGIQRCFRRLGLPVHSKEALASCEYYATVVDGLKQKKSAHLPSNKHSNTGAPAGRDASSNPPLENLSVATPAQLSRVAARVNPLCSVSPKACLMTEALIHEIFMALCEGVLRRSVQLQTWRAKVPLGKSRKVYCTVVDD